MSDADIKNIKKGMLYVYVSMSNTLCFNNILVHLYHMQFCNYNNLCQGHVESNLSTHLKKKHTIHIFLNKTIWAIKEYKNKNIQYNFY